MALIFMVLHDSNSCFVLVLDYKSFAIAFTSGRVFPVSWNEDLILHSAKLDQSWVTLMVAEMYY